jgi:hypothetical protein
VSVGGSRFVLCNAAPDERRRGFVLAIALLSILLIAALMAAVFFATTEETRTAVAVARSETALTDAESAVFSALAAIAKGTTEPPPVGETQATSDVLGGSSVHVTRLDSTLVWVVGESSGEGGNAGAVRRVGVFAVITIDSTGSIRVSPIPERGWSELF